MQQYIIMKQSTSNIWAHQRLLRVSLKQDLSENVLGHTPHNSFNETQPLAVSSYADCQPSTLILNVNTFYSI